MLSMLLLACGGTDPDTVATLDDWSGGEYAVYTLAADDACFDGALSALFMPAGPSTPHAFEYPVYLPDYDELPLDYTVDLREPFTSIPLSVSETNTAEMVGTGQIEGVLLGEAAYGDCTADFNVELLINPASATTADSTATIDITGLSGADGRCPVPLNTPCQITLELWAEAP